MEFVFEMESAATENCGPPVDPTNAAHGADRGGFAQPIHD